METSTDISAVAPALEAYARGPIAELWKRPELPARDRSVVTVAALIARNQTIEMRHYLNIALDNGVKPGELSEIITHLAFYSGWANAVSARMSLLSVRLGSISSLPLHLASFRSTKMPRRNAQRMCNSSL